MDFPLYACKPLADAGKENALILAERGGDYYAYELVGFPYLDDSPSIWAVCASYGIGAAEDLASVSVYDADGTPLYDIADADALSDFFDKFVKLGANLSDEEAAQAYYDAYVAAYGADEKLTLQNGNVEAADDEIYEKAMTLWSEGVCLVTIRLQNGLQLRDCIYAPVPGLFSVYGIYPITEPFF